MTATKATYPIDRGCPSDEDFFPIKVAPGDSTGIRFLLNFGYEYDGVTDTWMVCEHIANSFLEWREPFLARQEADWQDILLHEKRNKFEGNCAVCGIRIPAFGGTYRYAATDSTKSEVLHLQRDGRCQTRPIVCEVAS
jgi:hypothetical protein